MLPTSVSRLPYSWNVSMSGAPPLAAPRILTLSLAIPIRRKMSRAAVQMSSRFLNSEMNACWRPTRMMSESLWRWRTKSRPLAPSSGW